MSANQWAAWIVLVLLFLWAIGLVWYLFWGPGSSRWYK